jgi:hypothetical protein
MALGWNGDSGAPRNKAFSGFANIRELSRSGLVEQKLCFQVQTIVQAGTSLDRLRGELAYPGTIG